jgi:hypothetical protein
MTRLIIFMLVIKQPCTLCEHNLIMNSINGIFGAAAHITCSQLQTKLHV